MANLSISEFAAFIGAPQIAPLPPLVQQNVAIGAEADASAFSAQTRFIRLANDVACNIRVAASGPTAVTTDLYLPAGSTEYFAVQPTWILSVIAAA